MVRKERKRRTGFSRNPPGINEQFNGEPLGVEQLCIPIDSRQRKLPRIKMRESGTTRPHHAMPWPARTKRQPIVKRKAKGYRPTATPAIAAPPASQ